MNSPALVCESEKRRDRVRRSTLMGLDYLEVSPDQLTLTVYLLNQAPKLIKPANLQIQGGERITGIQVKNVTVQRMTTTADAVLTVKVDKYGDFSEYTLSVVELDDQGHPTAQIMSGFDPRYASLAFTFKAGCPSDLDCKNAMVCAPTERVEPDVNYLAKDYATFRQLILDRLALLMPAWQESHVPDIGITLVELLAYVGDYLSYYQDAVATEAYLATARQRISVRRHARLVDYHMHEGCNARAWLTIQTALDVPPPAINLADIWFSTTAASGTPEIFEPVACSPNDALVLFAAHNEIKFYTWGDKLCCLPKGTTQATLVDGWQTATPTAPATTGQPAAGEIPAAAAPAKRQLQLKAGDVLIFEEVKGPKTGNPADADPARRWAVRLTEVTPTVDPLKNQDGQTTPIVGIEWAVEDALPFPFCLSARLPAPDCRIICDISVARGNVILVDHGQTIAPPEGLGQVGQESETGTCECEGSAVEMTSVPCVFRPTLKQSPLTFCEKTAPGLPASQMLTQDPRNALPHLCLTSQPQAQTGDTSAIVTWIWRPLADLLESGSMDLNFVVEMDDAAVAHLRFGDGVLGRMPDAFTTFQAAYRIGNGTAGNVGTDTITEFGIRNSGGTVPGLKPRNPFPAQGGTDPEPVAEVKLFAPGAFKKVLERAITAADYAAIAGRNQQIQQANAVLRWTGSWYEAQVAVDPWGTETADAGLLQKIQGYLYQFRRMGHDLVVDAAQYVPLYIEVIICVLPQYLRGHVEASLLDIFSNRVLPNGQLGLFHPDNLTFGEDVCLSRLVAAAQAVTGVEGVKITKFQRYFEAANGELAAGIITLAPTEIAQLDNDPSFPEHGVLKLDMRGGR
jgi:hypothetical protein